MLEYYSSDDIEENEYIISEVMCDEVHFDIQSTLNKEVVRNALPSYFDGKYSDQRYAKTLETNKILMEKWEICFNLRKDNSVDHTKHNSNICIHD